MSKPLTTALAQFAAATTGRNITKAAYVAVTAGVLSMVLLTDKRADEAHDSVSGLLWTCLAYFVFEGLSGCTLVIRKGTQGDCRYFIAAGEVELDLPRRCNSAKAPSSARWHCSATICAAPTSRPRKCRGFWCSTSSTSAC